MKTICITSFHPVISRNVLATPFLDKLKNDHDIGKIVLLVPKQKTEYFNRRFKDSKVKVVGIRPGFSTETVTGLVFKRAARYLLATRTNTINSRFKFYKNKDYCYYFARSTLNYLGAFKFIRRTFRLCEMLVGRFGAIERLLGVLMPDLILSTDVQNENDVGVIKTAKRMGIRTISMVRSWDNLTVHGILRVFPDYLCVSSKKLAEYAIRFHDFPSKRIIMIGLLHLDNFFSCKHDFNNEKFLKEKGLDPLKKTLFYAPVGDRYIMHNTIDVDVITELQKTGHNIIVRFPPNDNVNLKGFIPGPNTFMDHPGEITSSKEIASRELSEDDNQMLMTEIGVSDVVICGPSTIALDGALQDKPIIMVDFYDPPRPYEERILCYDGYEHLQSIIMTGGIFLARSRESLLGKIEDYIKDGRGDALGREQIRKDHLSLNQGRASERLLEAIKKYLRV